MITNKYICPVFCGSSVPDPFLYIRISIIYNQNARITHYNLWKQFVSLKLVYNHSLELTLRIFPLLYRKNLLDNYIQFFLNNNARMH